MISHRRRQQGGKQKPQRIGHNRIALPAVEQVRTPPVARCFQGVSLHQLYNARMPARTQPHARTRTHAHPHGMFTGGAQDFNEYGPPALKLWGREAYNFNILGPGAPI